MRPTPITPLVAALIFLILSGTAQAISFNDVFIKSKDEAAFKRIGDLIPGFPVLDRKAAYPSNPDKMAGLYFICYLSDAPLSDDTFELSVFLKGEADARRFSYQLHPEHLKKEILLGITGEGPRLSPKDISAWRIRLIGSDGEIKTSKKSFLWEMP